MKMKTLVALSLLVLVATAGWAGTITVGAGGGTPYNTAALTGFSTTGAMMDGMAVRACLLNGTCSSAVWGATGAAAGAASTADWSLSLDGDSFSATWALDNLTQSPLVGLWINARPGHTVFDIVNGPSNSPGSANGYPVTYVPGANTFPDARAQYTDPLWIGGVFYQDLYLRLAIDFGDGFLGSVGLRMDTDNVDLDDDIIVIPEPGTYALMGAGLLALAAIRARKRA
jgi:hypothetical protein